LFINGVDENSVKVEKPAITPVVMNREMQSEFLKTIMSNKVKPILPVFIDYSTSINTTKLKSNIPVYSVKNTENNLFSLSYTVEMGNAQDKRWPLVMQYVDYLGTSKHNASQLQEEFYKLACSYSASASEDEITIRLVGINSNFNAALILLESLLAGPVADEAALKNLVDDVLKKRENAKLNKGEILSRVSSYARFGPVSAATYLMSEEELKQVTGKELSVLLRNLSGYMHRVDYYGPMETAKLTETLNKFHLTPRGLQAVTKGKIFTEETTDDGNVYFVNYEMKQAEVQFLSKGGSYDKNIQPVVQMYSRYFGGGMSSPVFQTMRESKALAYSVSSRYMAPNRLDRSYVNMAYIGTQADKLPEALDGMMELLQEMPVSAKSFNQAKEGVIQGIASDRITKMEILRSFHGLNKLGINYDLRKDTYEKISTMSLKDVEVFHLKYIKGKKYRIAVIGSKESINFKVLEKFGTVTELQLDQVFGY
jgi:predicted Zn-dependent peptidase